MTAQDVADLFRDLELRLIGSLKRNLRRHKRQEEQEGGQGGVPEQWEAWQSAKLRDLQRFRKENEQIVGAVSPAIDQGTKELIREQYGEGGSDGFFHMNDRRVKALLEEMENVQAQVEKAALRYMDDVYRRTVQGVALNMATGSMTMQQAVDMATKDFLAAGITCIQYRNGRRVNIASYAEMALRTAATRATLQGEAALREQLGIDTVLVSQYGACSDTCLPWQGLVYIDDVFQAYSGPHTPGGTYGVSRNGKQYPLLSVAVRAGLFHPNCRHTLTTWNEGVSRRPKPMDKAKIEATSRLESRQRYLERRVREAKRRAAGLLDPEAAKEAKRRVRRRQAGLKEFVEAHGDVLRRDPWRERYDGTVEQPLRNKARTGRENVLEEYRSTEAPGQGTITYDEGYDRARHTAEIKTAQWLHDTLGGDIVLLQENLGGAKKPDYIWRGKFWELKNITSDKAADSAVRGALKQIAEIPGGVILDCGENEIEISALQAVIDARISRSGKFPVDVLVLHRKELLAVWRYKK